MSINKTQYMNECWQRAVMDDSATLDEYCERVIGRAIQVLGLERVTRLKQPTFAEWAYLCLMESEHYV